MLSGQIVPGSGRVLYRGKNIASLGEPALRRLADAQLTGLCPPEPARWAAHSVLAGGNVGKRLIAAGARHYGNIRAAAREWLTRMEIDPARMHNLPRSFSGGMQQRLQIARTLVTHPALVFMDEPPGGLDVSVQARLLDLIRGLVADLGLSVLLVTHDIAAARLLSGATW